MQQPRCRRALALAIGLVGMAAMPAQAALRCEQLFAIAESAIEFRDQGHTLQQVLAGLKNKEIVGKLTADEIQVLYKAVTAVYLGNASATEVALTCKEAMPKK
jgi:hypothetical protein